MTQNKSQGFATSLPYWELPKGTTIKVALITRNYADIAMEKMSSTSFFSIKLDSKAGKALFEKAFSVAFVKMKTITFKDTKETVHYPEFSVDYHYPDLVKVLELVRDDC